MQYKRFRVSQNSLFILAISEYLIGYSLVRFIFTVKQMKI
jgi:hypothetical protein